MNYPEHCVLWSGKRDRDGYGCLIAGGDQRAHRVLFKLFCGPIPPGMCVLHSCDTPACVNPAHLRLGTQKENMADRDARGRTRRGVNNGMSKLNAEQVREIRAGISRHEALARFGIRKSAYYRVRNHEGYKDVSP